MRDGGAGTGSGVGGTSALFRSFLFRSLLLCGSIGNTPVLTVTGLRPGNRVPTRTRVVSARQVGDHAVDVDAAISPRGIRISVGSGAFIRPPRTAGPRRGPSGRRRGGLLRAAAAPADGRRGAGSGRGTRSGPRRRGGPGKLFGLPCTPPRFQGKKGTASAPGGMGTDADAVGERVQSTMPRAASRPPRVRARDPRSMCIPPVQCGIECASCVGRWSRNTRRSAFDT